MYPADPRRGTLIGVANRPKSHGVRKAFRIGSAAKSYRLGRIAKTTPRSSLKALAPLRAFRINVEQRAPLRTSAYWTRTPRTPSSIPAEMASGLVDFGYRQSVVCTKCPSLVLIVPPMMVSGVNSCPSLILKRRAIRGREDNVRTRAIARALSQRHSAASTHQHANCAHGAFGFRCMSTRALPEPQTALLRLLLTVTPFCRKLTSAHATIALADAATAFLTVPPAYPRRIFPCESHFQASSVSGEPSPQTTGHAESGVKRSLARHSCERTTARHPFVSSFAPSRMRTAFDLPHSRASKGRCCPQRQNSRSLVVKHSPSHKIAFALLQSEGSELHPGPAGTTSKCAIVATHITPAPEHRQSR